MVTKEMYTSYIALTVWQWQQSHPQDGLCFMLDIDGIRRTKLWVINEFAPMIAEALFEQESDELDLEYTYIPQIMMFFEPWEYALLTQPQVDLAIARIHGKRNNVYKLETNKEPPHVSRTV